MSEKTVGKKTVSEEEAKKEIDAVDETEREEAGSAHAEAADKTSLFTRLYTGTGAFEIVGRRKLLFRVTLGIVLLCLASFAIRGFTFGIEFVGGTSISFPAEGKPDSGKVARVVADATGHEPVSVQTVGAGSSATVQIRTGDLNNAQTAKVTDALFGAFQPKGHDGKPSKAAVNVSSVSSSWGGQITVRALIALGVFLLAVGAYIAIRFELDMALAAIASLFFDLLVTAGVYSIVGFEVVPATVIGLLTILGFSLYDTVVVFDKVAENVRGVTRTTRRTYAELANLAMNQTMMRSINTTVIGVLPVLGLIVVAVLLLGVGTLKDLALVQLVGLISGAYSSIFVATPLLVTLKERRQEFKRHNAKVASRRRQAEADAA
ncbi:MAG: protein translocase subunit SecF [Segniliparus sp.]|uniref:protein translocase subunit SecF n=1 Tax=Segniliparus sp. TaxID=2804064 RepID=UPI003F2B42D4